MTRYDYIAWVKEEVGILKKELNEPGVRDQIAELARRLDIEPELALAAFHRAAKRSGFTLKVLFESIAEQLRRAAVSQS